MLTEQLTIVLDGTAKVCGHTVYLGSLNEKLTSFNGHTVERGDEQSNQSGPCGACGTYVIVRYYWGRCVTCRRQTW